MANDSAALAVNSVLILDDIAETRSWLALIVTAAFPGVAIVFAASVAEAKSQLASIEIDLALLDLGLDDGSGLEVLATCGALSKPPACVVTTVFDDDGHLFAALRGGARGYLLKDRPAEELTIALRGIVAGQPPLSPAIATRLLRFFNPMIPAGEALSVRETEVLVLVSKGFTVAETARSLGLAPSTVSGYVKDVYRKLRICNRAEAALEAQRRGLLN